MVSADASEAGVDLNGLNDFVRGPSSAIGYIYNIYI